MGTLRASLRTCVAVAIGAGLLMGWPALQPAHAANPEAVQSEGSDREGDSAADPVQAALTAAKSAYRFAEWPGKDGELRPGVDVRSVLTVFLSDVELIAARHPRAILGTRGGEMTIVDWVGNGLSRCYVKIIVATSCEAAQELLVQDLACRQKAGIDPSGAELGIQLGDVSFPAAVRTRFVRSNVVVEVTANDGNAVEIAEAIDQSLLARPTFESYEAMAPYRPEIRKLHLKGHPAEPLHVEEYVGNSKRFPLEFEVADPQGGQLVLSWEGSPGISVRTPETKQKHTHEVCVEVWGPESEIQHRELTLTAVNVCGMFSRTTIPVEVRVFKKELDIGQSE